MSFLYEVTISNGCGTQEVRGEPTIHEGGLLTFRAPVETFTSGEGMEGRLSAGVVFQTPDVLVASFATGCWAYFTMIEEDAAPVTQHGGAGGKGRIKFKNVG